MKPHKHAELIKAWADGAEIEKQQIYCKYQMNEEPIIVSEEWLPCHSPTWAWNETYRIKPEPKPDWYRHYMVAEEGNGIYPRGTCEQMNANLRLWFDGETGKLKDAEIVK